jgi:hypothetical protein
MTPSERRAHCDRIVARNFDLPTLEQMLKLLNQIGVDASLSLSENTLSGTEIDAVANRIAGLLHTPFGVEVLITILPSLIEAAKRDAQLQP